MYAMRNTPRGEGGVLFSFFFIRNLDSASADYPKKYPEYQATHPPPPKKIKKNRNPKNIFRFSTLALNKLVMYINDPQNS